MHTLVLLPGLLCDAALFAPQIEDLRDITSPWVADLTRDDTIAGMARRVLADAPEGPLALAGLSMGGYVAQEIIRQARERVQRLALLDTRSRTDEPDETKRRRLLMKLAQSQEGFAPVTSRMLPLLIHPERVGDATLVTTIREMAERVGVEAYLRQQAAIIARPDFRAVLDDIRCPALILCGRQDVLTPVAFHEEMAQRIPQARLEIIENCGHLATLEQPRAVNARLRHWLEATLP